MWKTGHSLIKAKMKELDGSTRGGDERPHVLRRRLPRLRRRDLRRGPPAGDRESAVHSASPPHLADLPKTYATPEIRVDAPEEEKFAIVERAAAHFAARYPVNTIDGVRITFPKGWGLLRASNTQADPGAAVRGHRPGRARRLPRRGRRAGSPNRACASSP